MKRVVLLGGSFDPVHCGHLCAARECRRLLEADATWLVPAGISPGRTAMLPVQQRLQLLGLAIAGEMQMEIFDYEINKPGPSYTYDTWQYCVSHFPDTEFWWCMGADVARGVSRWHRAEELLATARFVITTRAGHAPVPDSELSHLGFRPAACRSLAIPCPEVSSTEVRTRLAAGLPVADLVPAAVAQSLADSGAYRTGMP